MGRLKKREFQPTDDQLNYLKAYVDNPAMNRRQVAEKCGVSLDRVTKWYGTNQFVQWLLAKTSDLIDAVVLGAARRRVAIDLQSEGKAGSEAALKIYLREIDRKNNASFTKGQGNNPLAIVLQIGSEPGSGTLHPAAEIIESQIQDADFEKPKKRKGRKKKP